MAWGSFVMTILRRVILSQGHTGMSTIGHFRHSIKARTEGFALWLDINMARLPLVGQAQLRTLIEGAYGFSLWNNDHMARIGGRGTEVTRAKFR